MADKTTIDAVVATPRTGTFNKGHARRVRVAGLDSLLWCMARAKPSVAVTVDPKVITKILYSGVRSQHDLRSHDRGLTARRRP